MIVTNYRVKASLTSSNPPVGVDALILTGAENSTVIKSLELISGTESSIAYIFRKDGNGNTYGSIKVDLKANNYVMLWEGFIAIPAGHTVYLNADSNQVEAVASVVEL